MRQKLIVKIIIEIENNKLYAKPLKLLKKLKPAGMK